MATVNALSVALFNAAAGGYASELTANPAAFANAVGPVLQKDVSTDALFVDHLLANLGVTSTSSVYAQAKAAVAALVTTKGRAGAATDAIDFLKAQEGSTNAYASIAADFAAKVNKAAAFTLANATERDITRLISGVTGVDTDVVAINNAVAAQKAADDAATAKAVADAAVAAKAAADATAAATLKAAQDKAAADLKAAQDKAAADLIAATTKAAADVAAQKAADDAAAATAAAKAAADLKAAQDQITALKNPAGSTYALSSSTDVVAATAGNDTITGSGSQLGTADVIIDTTSTDADTLTITGMTANMGATVIAGIETINLNTTVLSGTAFTVDGTNVTGVKALNIARGDLLNGQVSGKGDVTVNPIKGAQVAAVNVTGVGTGATSVTQSTSGGTILTTDGSGTVTLTGGGTVNAAAAAGTVKVDPTTTTALAAAATTVTAPLATTIDLNDHDFTGKVTVNAAKAATVDVTLSATSNAGADINVGSGVAAGVTLSVTGINTSGANITTGSSGSLDATNTSTVGSVTTGSAITLGGTSAATDVASVKASGYIALDVGATPVDIVTLSGNGSAVDYSVSHAFTSLTKAGTDSVTVRADSDLLTAKTVTADAIIINGSTTGAAKDLSKITGNIIVGADISQNTTVAAGANLKLAVDQTSTTIYSATNRGSLTLSTGDDTSDGSAATISTGAVTLGTTGKTFASVAINATDGIFSATTFDAGSTSTTAAAVTITGNKAVTITGGYSTTTNSAVASTVKAASIDASALTGGMTIKVGADLTTLNTGTGSDSITVDDRSTATTGGNTNFVANGTVQYVINAGSGSNSITLTSLGGGSQIYGGSGADSVTIGHAAAVLVSTSSGNDTVTVNANIDTDAVIAMGDGTNDSLVLSDTDGNDFSDNANFAFTGVENLTISTLTSGTDQINSAQLAGNPTFTLTGNATADSLTVVGKYSTTGNTIDASGITVSSATVVLQGNALNDTITGTSSADTINQTTGADVIAGGSGTDTFVSLTLGSGVNDSTNSAAADIAGEVYNFGANAVTAASVSVQTGNYLSSGVTSVATGKVAWTFATQSANNSSNVQTLSSIEKIVGTSGPDYFVANDSGQTFTGGAGNDYIKLGGGADTVVFASTLAGNGKDTITGFTLGASSDKLDFSAFLGAAADATNGSSTSTIGITMASAGVKLETTSGGTTTADANVAVIYQATAITSSQIVADAGAATGKIAMGASQKAVILVAAASTSTTYDVYEVTAGSVPGTSDVISLVGTITSNAISNFDLTNVVGA